MTVVLDASVAIAWYLPEPWSEAARRWQERMLEGSAALVVPSLHFWEVGNVLRTKVRREELDPDLARRIYETHLDAPLKVSDPDRRVVLGTALAYDATTYDAVYVTLALELDAHLLTAERSTTPWVAKLGPRADCLSSP